MQTNKSYILALFVVLAHAAVTQGEPTSSATSNQYVLVNIRPSEVRTETFRKIAELRAGSARLASSGELKEAHLAEVVRRHLADLSATARAGGLPRD